MNGLSKRDDVVGFFEHIGDLNMLHLDSSSGYELAGILYHVERDYFMATYYKNEEDIVRFICYPIDRFVYYHDYASEVELEISRAGNIDTELVGNFDICSTTVGLHTVENTKSPFALIGKFETDNSLITILLTENDEAVIKNSISKNIIRTMCMDLIEN